MKFTFLLLVVSVLSFSVRAQEIENVKIELDYIFKKSLELRKDVRSTALKYGFESPQMDSLNNIITSFDKSSLIKVIDIVDEYGWLGISQIENMANQALYLTIQHAQSNEVRIKYFPLLKASAEKGDSNLADMATMHDRILVGKGESQLYGTQYKLINGKNEFFPIEEIKYINKRRRKVGLKKLRI